jgi:hypothetical protein
MASGHVWNYVMMRLPNQEVVEGHISGYRLLNNIIDVKVNGIWYSTHMSNVVLMVK